MIEREVLEDIGKYKPKLVANLTKREFFCTAIALFVVFKIYKKLSILFIPQFCVVVALVVAAPILLCGYKEFYGMPFEKFALHYVTDCSLTSSKRDYSSDNIYDSIYLSDTDIEDNNNDDENVGVNALTNKEKRKRQKKEEKEIKKQIKAEKDKDYIPI